MSTAHPLVGIGYMAASGLCFVAMTAIVKVVGNDLPAAETGFLRYLLGLPFLLPMWGELRRGRFGRDHWKLFGFRGLVHAVAVILWFFAMTRIPLAEVTAMNYLSPIYVTLGAALFLGEKLAARRLTAIAIALLGALVILRPGFRALGPGHLSMLIASMFFAASYLSAKLLSGRASATLVVAMLSLTVPIVLFPFAIANWVAPSPAALLWLFLTAAVATAGHYLMTLAFAAAPLTVTQPVTFLQLVWAVTLGALAFGEGVDVWVVAGGAMIMGAIGYMTLREAQLRRRATPAVGETRI